MSSDAGSPEAAGFDPFAGPAILSAAPTTGPQRELWLGSATSPGASLSFNESVTLRFGEGLHLEALLEGFSDLVARHEALRSTFSTDGTTVMVTEAAFRVPFEDWSALPAPDRAERLAELKAEEVETAFDLEHGPLFRVKVVRCAPDEVIAVFTAHHIVCDGWSIGVLMKDWGSLYQARVAGVPAPLPPAERFSDYARAEAERIASPEAAVHERFWLGQYAGEIPVLELPTDRSRPPTRSYESRRCDVPLDAELVQAVKRAGVKQRASFFATLLAGFNALLFRLSGQEDLVVGIPSAGQSVGGHATLVGHCVNMLPVRTLLEAKVPFGELVGRVRKGMLDASEHQEYTFGTLLTKLPISRDPSRPPLVSVVFNVDRALTGEAMGFAQLPVVMSTNPRRSENFDLFINAVETPSGTMVLECQYSTPIFDDATIHRWLRSFEQLLRAAVASPDQAIGALPIVSPEDQAQIAAWNAQATAELPPERTVHQLIAAQVARTPGARACVGETHTLQYADLDQRANQLARKLRAMGVKKGSLVGLSVERSPHMLVGLLGILKAGAAYVPLDPGYPRDRLAFMVEDSGMQVLVTEDKPRAELNLAARHVVSLDGDAVLLQAEPGAALEPGADDAGPDDGAYVIYTSGSTGKPKGVLVPHSAVVNLLNSVKKRPGLSAKDVVLAVTTLSFDIAVSELILPLTVGATIVLASREVAADGGRLLELFTRSNITFIDATPATYRLLLAAGWTGGPSLKVICTGEALPKDLAQDLVGRVGELWNGYGPTETTVWSTFFQVTAPVDRILIGKPVDNTQLYVLDPSGQPTPLGVPGELFIAGAGVSSGYLCRPELTRERFLPDPFSQEPGARMYKTGDVARFLRSGDVECLGRNDNQVKLRGYRIELGEIEDALGQHPAVRQCAVIVREDRPGDKRLVGYAALRPDATVTDAELRTHLKRSLPDYMVPVLYVRLPTLPLTPSGKINRKALPAPDPGSNASTGYVAPTTPSQKLLAKLWQEALAIPRVGVTDDFFALGGHSLLASQILARLRRDHGIELSFRKIFEASTLEKLAELIDHAEVSAPGSGTPPVTRRKGEAPVPLSVAQERIWLLEEMDPAQELVHNLPAAWLFKGAVKRDVLERALEEIVRRHDTTRTVLQVVDGRAEQVVIKDMTLPLRLVDFRDRTEEALLEALAEATREKFDLAKGPLLRWSLYQVSEQAFVLFTVRHSLIWDGWSFDVFLRELTQLYAAFDAGQPSPLKELPVSYGDYVLWQRDYLSSKAMEKQITFWRRQLAGELPELKLPSDRERQTKTGHGGGYTTFKFTRADAEAFTALGRASGGTLFMALFAAYSVVLHRYSQQNELLIGSPVRGRGRPELEDLIGAFINAVVLRVKLKPDMTFAQLIEHVRDMTLDSFSHEDMPLERLGARPPVVRALFSLQDARLRPPSLGSIPVEQKHVELSAASNDMMVWMMDQRLSLIAVVNFSTELFDKETVDRFLRGYAAVLQAAVKNPGTKLSELPIASPEDHEQARRFGQPEAAVARSVSASLGELGSTRAGEPALAVGQVTLSGRELLARVDAVAHALAGWRAGQKLVAVLAADPLARALGVLGALRAGVPFTVLDATGPASRVAGVCAALSPDVVLVDAGASAPAGVPSINLGELPAAEAFAAPEINGAAPAWVTYRLDASGRVHARAVSQAALASLARGVAERVGLTPGAQVASLSAPTVDRSLLELLAPLLAGSTVWLASPAVKFGALGPSTGLQAAFAPDAFWARATPADVARVERVVVTGGTTTELVDGLLQASRRVFRIDGFGEATFAQELAKGAAPARLGRPVFPTRVLLRGSDAQPAPVTVPGELLLGTAQPVDAALDRWSPRAEALAATGRRARFLNDGTFELTQDLAGEVQAAGHRFEVGELTGVLERYPGVKAAHVALARKGTGLPRLTAFLQLEARATYTETELRKHVRSVLPEHLMPQAFEEVEALPRTGGGVVDEVALLARFAERGQTFVAPRTASEKLVAQVWAEALNAQRVSVYDNFFALGGYSLLCFKVIAALEERTKVRLGPRVILQGSLEQVAAALDGAGRAPVAAPTPVAAPRAPLPEARAEGGGLFRKLRDLVKGPRD